MLEEFDELSELEFDELLESEFDELFELELDELLELEFDELFELELDELLELEFDELFELEFDELLEFELDDEPPCNRMVPRLRSTLRFLNCTSSIFVCILAASASAVPPIFCDGAACVLKGSKARTMAEIPYLKVFILFFPVLTRIDALTKEERFRAFFIPSADEDMFQFIDSASHARSEPLRRWR